MKTIAVAVLALALTGCGSAREHGTATLWVTRDDGAHVLYSGTVPAGLTALQALDRRMPIETRYGGRFVQAIDGVEGDASKRRDWFYFVNGVEAARGAADVRLRDGDVEWWDYRSWQGDAMSVPVVVGAFPEPFLHGFDWVNPGALFVAPAAHRGLLASLREGIRPYRRRDLGHGPVNTIVIDLGVPRDTARIARRGNAVWLTLGERAARRLAQDRNTLRYRYGVR